MVVEENDLREGEGEGEGDGDVVLDPKSSPSKPLL